MAEAWVKARQVLATEYSVASRRGTDPDPERIAELRGQLHAARAEFDIQRILATAPPLTGEQIARLRMLLPRPSESAGSDAA